MIQSKHCELCEHEKRNLKDGLTCGLTNKKPPFENSCSDIKFSNAFKGYLPELLRQIEQLRKKKTSVYLNFTLFGAIGLIIILGSYSRLEKTFEMEFSYSSWIYLAGTFLIYLIGTLLISMGFRPLYKYRKSLQKLESDKSEISMVLKNYNTDITTLINLEKK